jgi:hypothetical protein
MRSVAAALVSGRAVRCPVRGAHRPAHSLRGVYCPFVSLLASAPGVLVESVMGFFAFECFFM